MRERDGDGGGRFIGRTDGHWVTGSVTVDGIDDRIGQTPEGKEIGCGFCFDQARDGAVPFPVAKKFILREESGAGGFGSGSEDQAADVVQQSAEERFFGSIHGPASIKTNLAGFARDFGAVIPELAHFVFEAGILVKIENVNGENERAQHLHANQLNCMHRTWRS